jgi:hypothetical protein
LEALAQQICGERPAISGNEEVIVLQALFQPESKV